MDDDIWIPPFSLLWASISCVPPPIGHMAISDSRGVIHDFGGFINISETKTIFGCPKCYFSFENDLTVEQKEAWDTNIMLSEEKFKGRAYNLFAANCHHFAANVLNRCKVSENDLGVINLITKYRLHMRKLK